MDATATPVEAAPVRAIGSADLNWALARGWDDFKEKRGDLILLPFIYVVAGVLASVFAFNARLFPMIFPLAAGFALVGPAAAAGFYELARRRENGEDANWWHFLDPLKGRARLPLAMLTAMLAVLFLGWLAAAWGIYQATLGTLAPPTPDDFVRDLFYTPQGWTMIVVGNGVGALFALATLAVSTFSFPMVIDKPVDPLAAIATSVKAFQASPLAVAGWGVRVALILLLAALPLFVGLIVALPVLGYATWHLYTRAVVR